MSVPRSLVGTLVTLERIDTREPVSAVVWEAVEPDETVPGLPFLRRRFRLEAPSQRASVYAIMEGGLVLRGEVNADTLHGFGVLIAQSIDDLDLPPLDRSYPDSVPRLWPV